MNASRPGWQQGQPGWHAQASEGSSLLNQGGGGGEGGGGGGKGGEGRGGKGKGVEGRVLVNECLYC